MKHYKINGHRCVRCLIYHVIFFLTLLSASIAQARIGDTLSQCIERYGEPFFTGVGPVNAIEKRFRFKEHTISLCFVNGRAVCVFYTRDDGGKIENYANLLIVNNNKGDWPNPEINPDGDLMWMTSDGRLGAVLTADKKMLMVLRPEFAGAFMEWSRNKKNDF